MPEISLSLIFWSSHTFAHIREKQRAHSIRTSLATRGDMAFKGKKCVMDGNSGRHLTWGGLEAEMGRMKKPGPHEMQSERFQARGGERKAFLWNKTSAPKEERGPPLQYRGTHHWALYALMSFSLCFFFRWVGEAVYIRYFIAFIQLGTFLHVIFFKYFFCFSSLLLWGLQL